MLVKKIGERERECNFMWIETFFFYYYFFYIFVLLCAHGNEAKKRYITSKMHLARLLVELFFSVFVVVFVSFLSFNVITQCKSYTIDGSVYHSYLYCYFLYSAPICIHAPVAFYMFFCYFFFFTLLNGLNIYQYSFFTRFGAFFFFSLLRKE